jgi:hypothetical protein
MLQIINKLLVVLLAIVLGMSFQHGAVAGFVSTGTQFLHLNQPIELADTNLFSVSDDTSIQESSGSVTSDCSKDKSCSLGHCATCVLAMFPAVLSSESFTSSSVLSVNPGNFVSHRSSPLFRPPKI